jgi:hypothetical protein
MQLGSWVGARSTSLFAHGFAERCLDGVTIFE